MIRIFAIGKKHEDWVLAGIERYQKRLQPPFNVEWTLLPHSTFEQQKARDEESSRVLERLSPGYHVVLLDEHGKKQSSVQFSHMLEQQFNHSKDVVMVIGGAYGVNDALIERADDVLSLSDMVFPHQLVRLLLVEQLYRAQEIARGTNYHHA